VSRARHGELSVTYSLSGDIERVRVPALRASAFADELWQHTCFELFYRRQAPDPYCELNFSPSGEWAAYAFERYREGMRRRRDVLAQRIAVRRRERALELEASISAPELEPAGPLSVAVSAIVEETDGTMSYWSLKHAAEKPDFHHRDAFVLQLS
jgi:hypothetical protein